MERIKLSHKEKENYTIKLKRFLLMFVVGIAIEAVFDMIINSSINLVNTVWRALLYSAVFEVVYSCKEWLSN